MICSKCKAILQPSLDTCPFCETRVRPIDKMKELERYKDFVYLDEPEVFCVLFKDQDADLVQVHDMNGIMQDDPVGFFGDFGWQHNEIVWDDGDGYSLVEAIYGYRWFTKEGKKCLDILINSEEEAFPSIPNISTDNNLFCFSPRR